MQRRIQYCHDTDPCMQDYTRKINFLDWYKVPFASAIKIRVPAVHSQLWAVP